MDFDALLLRGPYSMAREEKAALFSARMTELTAHHAHHCPEYARLLTALGHAPGDPFTADTVPMVPVSLFKALTLRSIPEAEIFKTMTSSGTTGQAVSKICLDSGEAARQQRVLCHIGSSLVGERRLPYLVIDSARVLKDRALFSARGAGILGFSVFASKTCYALNEDMSLDLERVEAFLAQYGQGPILLFGFTYIIWRQFLEALEAKGRRLDIPQGVLIHGGGWKKLANQAVSPEAFKARLRDAAGLAAVCDYYGMAEQTGCIALECPEGHLHVSNWSDIRFRRPSDGGLCAVGEPGILQSLSLLPQSYPGHSLLTEDMGVLLGEDDCPCGRRGRYFSVLGRIPQAEVRGCSDTYEG